jgi:hypothetical protein
MRQEPLIVTLTLDDAAQAFFDALRRAHFPPARLVVGAHVTMFHAIPPEREADLLQSIEASCAATRPFAVTVVGVRFLGRGAAYALGAPRAQEVRAGLAQAMAGSLSAQDSARWSPHITIQNKVAPDVARQTLSILEGTVPPACICATGLAVWRYCGGPWDAVDRFAFGATAA